MTTSYDNSKLRSYTFANVDFGASDTTEVIAAPLVGRSTAYGALPNARGRVKGFHVFNVTEIFAGTTTQAGVHVGDGTDADAYFASDTSLAGGALNTLAVGKAQYVADSGSGVADIPASLATDLTITFVAGTGTPTGIADVTVEIEWFDL